MHMLHVTHLLHIPYWIKIWTPADIQNIEMKFTQYKIAILSIESR